MKSWNPHLLICLLLLCLGCGQQRDQADRLNEFNTMRELLRDSGPTMDESNARLEDDVRQLIKNSTLHNEKWKEEQIEVMDEIHGQTVEMLEYLAALQMGLEVIADKDPQTGDFRNMKETERNGQFWMGTDELANEGRGNGHAFDLHLKLTRFRDWANAFLEAQVPGADPFAPIVMDPADNPAIPSTSDQKTQPWEYFTFHQKPVIADLAMVQKFKLEVQAIQLNLINAMEIKIKAYQSAFGAGDSVSEGGLPSSSPKVKVRAPDGSLHELPQNGNYKVRKPEVVLTPKPAALIRGKENSFTVDAPALGEYYNPQFKATGGRIMVHGSQKNKVTLVPTGATCKLEVYSLTNGQEILLDEFEFAVIDP